MTMYCLGCGAPQSEPPTSATALDRCPSCGGRAWSSVDPGRLRLADLNAPATGMATAHTWTPQCAGIHSWNEQCPS